MEFGSVRRYARGMQTSDCSESAELSVDLVGSACGANPVALAIPCHRALRSDGQLGGYAWGLERKRKLLEIEARTAARPGPGIKIKA